MYRIDFRVRTKKFCTNSISNPVHKFRITSHAKNVYGVQNINSVHVRRTRLAMALTLCTRKPLPVFYPGVPLKKTVR